MRHSPTKTSGSLKRPRVLARAVRAIALLLIALCLAAVAHANAPLDDGLGAGEFVWMPDLAPRGPVVVVVSLPAQRAYVYRNGVRIGVSTISSGKPGYETPTGVFTILQKHREHYSNLYDNAPMPFMQRLTWGGLALHAGGLPGYPASHGCVRLPKEFAEALYGVTARGTTVVIAGGESFPPTVTSPGLFTPVDHATGASLPEETAKAPFAWTPERAPEGPLTVLLSLTDRRMVVLRNGIEIGRAPVAVRDLSVGTRAFVLLEGTRPEPGAAVPDRPALRWMTLDVPHDSPATPDPRTAILRTAIAEGRLMLPAEFTRRVYDLLAPGATVVVTDEPLQPAGAGITVLRSDAPAGEEDVDEAIRPRP